MPKPLMCYTEAEFTDWVCKILSLTHPNDHFDLQEELAIYRETVPPYFARQMTRLTERLTKEGIDNTSIPCYAKNITESVKAWHTDRKLPCFCAPGLPQFPRELTDDELTALVKSMLGLNPTQEEINLYHCAVVRKSAPDFLNVTLNTGVNGVVHHIKIWHALCGNDPFWLTGDEGV